MLSWNLILVCVWISGQIQDVFFSFLNNSHIYTHKDLHEKIVKGAKSDKDQSL